MFQIKGRIDTTNAAEFEKELLAEMPTEIDAAELEYITSAGLHALLKLLQSVDGVTMYNVNPDVMEILEITGFDDMMEIKNK